MGKATSEASLKGWVELSVSSLWGRSHGMLAGWWQVSLDHRADGGPSPWNSL